MRRSAVLCALLLTSCAHTAALHGTVLSPAPLAHGFTLTDQQGKPFSLADLRGRAVALYFGFTHCTDVCPQTLAMLGKARREAHLRSRQAAIVMISVDPKRDTPAALREFFRRIGVHAIGLTGARAQLAPVYRAYGVAVEDRPHDVLHTDTIFIIAPSGRLRELIDPQTAPSVVAQDLRAIVG